MITTSRHRSRTAFTLIEAVISLALVSVVLVAALSTFGATARTRAVQTANQQRDMLAGQLMSEILRAAYTDPDVDGSAGGREVGEGDDDRATWDDVDDYNGLANEPPLEPDGTPMARFTGWTRSVNVHNVNPADPSEIGSPLVQTGLKHITVTVTDAWGGQTTHVSMKSRDGINDATLASDLNYTSWVGVELQVGDHTSARLSSGTALLNHPPPAAMNLLSNPGFEDGTTHWIGFFASINEYTPWSHGGARSIAVTNRAASWAGAYQDVTGHLVSGKTYRFRVWAAPHDTPACLLVPMATLYFDEDPIFLFGDPVWVFGDWTEITFDFTPVFTGTPQAVYVGVLSSDSQPVTDFLLDDAILHGVNQ
ncbi:MAG: hypothetical protein GY715_12465 [Planctomycetes bacterium]|nr:hypothetical protein [Planctomycetota bacterium]